MLPRHGYGKAAALGSMYVTQPVVVYTIYSMNGIKSRMGDDVAHPASLMMVVTELGQQWWWELMCRIYHHEFMTLQSSQNEQMHSHCLNLPCSTSDPTLDISFDVCGS